MIYVQVCKSMEYSTERGNKKEHKCRSFQVRTLQILEISSQYVRRGESKNMEVCMFDL